MRDWSERVKREREEAQAAFQNGDKTQLIDWALRYGHKLVEGYEVFVDMVDATDWVSYEVSWSCMFCEQAFLPGESQGHHSDCKLGKALRFIEEVEG